MGEGKTGILPRKFGLRTFKAFCERPFVLKPETDKQNVDVAPPWKNFCRCPCVRPPSVECLFTGDCSERPELVRKAFSP